MSRSSSLLSLAVLILLAATLGACGTRVAPVPPPNRVQDSNSY